MKKWSEVVADPRFQELPEEGRLEARQEYFNLAVQEHKIPQEDEAAAWGEFSMGSDADMKLAEVPEEVMEAQPLDSAVEDQPQYGIGNKPEPRSFIEKMTGTVDLEQAPKVVDFLSDQDVTMNEAAGGAALQATLGMSESIFRTPDAVARHYDALAQSGRDLGVAEELLPKTEDMYIPDAINLRKHGNIVADEISKAQTILVENFDLFKALSAKSEKANIAFDEALGGDTEKLQKVLMDPVAWAGFIGNAAPSLYAAIKSGGSAPFIAWMEGMEVASDAASFEKETGIKIDDREFARSQMFVMGINTWLEKSGLDKIMTSKGLLGAFAAGVTEGTTEGLQEFTQNVAKKMGWRPEQSLSEGVLPAIMGGQGTGMSVNVVKQSVEAMANSQQKVQSEKLKRAQEAFAKLQSELEKEIDTTNTIDEINTILTDKETFDEVVQAFDQYEAEQDAQKKVEMDAGFAEINKNIVEPAALEPAAETTEGQVAQSIASEKAARKETGKPKSAMEAAFEKAAPKKYGLSVEEAATEAATSPENNIPEPTEAQKEAGNYKKGHTKVQGLDVAIENPKGSIRKGTDEGGQKWSQKLDAHYGYIKRTQGADGDHVDVFLGPDSETANTFYVVNQNNPKTGKFDEHKVMIGYPDAKSAEAAYMKNYEKGWGGFGTIVPLDTAQFKRFLHSKAKTSKALPDSASILLAKKEPIQRALKPKTRKDIVTNEYDVDENILEEMIASFKPTEGITEQEMSAAVNKLDAGANQVTTRSGTPIPPLTKILNESKKPVKGKESAAYTEKRLESIAREYSYTNDRVRASVAWVSPLNFLRATVHNPALIFQETREENGKLNQDILQNESGPITINYSNGQAVGHEGRHRMALLYDAGIRRVPILLINNDSRTATKESGLGAKASLKGQDYGDGALKTLNVEGAVDISFDNKQALKNEFGGRKEQIMLAKKEGKADEKAKPKTAQKTITETGPALTSPIPLSRLNDNPTSDVYGKLGEVGKKTESLTPYNLEQLVADPTQVTDLVNDLGFEVKYYSFHKDEAAGVEFTSPKVNKQNYTNGVLWVYDARNSDMSFQETEYVRQWRIIHELSHALTDTLMQQRYGDSRREGRLGQPLEVTRGNPANKQVKITIEPLTLKEAQRMIEWEDVAFRVQRMLLSELGVKTSPAEFAKEYNINMADALHRVLTGEFADAAKEGFVPKESLPNIKSVLKLLENTEKAMAAEQGRKPTKGINLESHERVNVEKLQKIITKAKNEGPMPSKTGKKGKTLTVEYIDKVLKIIQKNWINAPNMVAVESAHDLPSNLKEEMIKEGDIESAGAIYDPNTGTAYFFANKTENKKEIIRFVLHEIAGHHGLRGLLDGEMDPFLREVYRSNRKNIEERARVYGVPLTSDKARLNMANEYLASLAETDPQSTFVTRAIAKIAQWLRKTFPSFKLTQSEIREVVVAMRKFVQTGERVQLAMNTVKQTQHNLRHTNDLDQTNYRKFKSFFKRNFTKEGLLNDEAFESKIKSDSLKKASEEDISFVIHKFEQAIAKALGVKNYSEVSEQKLEEINDYLHGNKDIKIPAELQENLDGMRTYLDRLSKGMLKALNEMMNIQLDKLSQKQKDAFKAFLNGDPNGYVPAKIQNHFEMFMTISKNLGTYMNRSYEAFDNPKWKGKILKNKELIARAEAFIEESNPDLTADEVHGAVRAILQAAQDKGNFFSFLSGGVKYGEKNVTMLNQRKDVPDVIRELLGEYKDPRINFARSATNMYMYLANHEFLMQLRQKGMGTFLFERPIGEFDKPIKAKNAESMNPLDGLYTTPEFIQGLEDMSDAIEGGAVMRGFIRLNSAVKYGKTILAPTTQARNFMSAAFFSIMNGHFDWSHGSKAYRAARSDLFTKKENWRKYLNKLITLGVLHDNPRSEELRAAIEDFMSIDVYAKGPTKSLRRFLNFMQRLYQVGDDFWKIIGYENEFALQRKAGLSVAEAEEKAAFRIRNGYPTYSMVPRSIKLIRRWPLIGTFVSFPYEIVRTSFNQVGFIKEDIANGNKQMAAQRSLGMAMATSVSAALSYMTMMMMGLDDEDDESVRNLAAPWMRNSQLVYTGYDESGYPQYIDFSYYDPYTYLKKPITAILNSNNAGIDKKIMDAGIEFLEPFIGVDIAAGALIELYTNKRADTGGKVYNESASVDEIATNMIDHFRKAAQPGAFSNAERMIKAIRGETSPSGKEYKVLDETVALVGFRMGTLNIPQSIYYKSLEFKDMKSLASQQLSKVVGSGQSVDDEDIKSGFKGMIKARKEAFTEMIKVVNAAEKLGMTKNDLRKVLKASKVSDGDIRYLLSDRIPPWRMSSSFLDSAEKRAMATADKDKRGSISKDLYERKKLVHYLASEEARNKED